MYSPRCFKYKMNEIYEKKTLLGYLFIGMLLNGGFASCERQEMQNSARIELLDNSWNMNYPSTAQAELGAVTQADSLPAIEEIEKGFAIAFIVNLEVPTFDRHILEIPGILDVCLRQHNPLDRNKQNYLLIKCQTDRFQFLKPDWN